MVTFRDSSVVILDTSRDSVKGVLGLGDLLHVPSIEIQARVGLRHGHAHGLAAPPMSRANSGQANEGTPAASTSRAATQGPTPGARVNDYIVGTALDEALAAGQDIAVYWPFADGTVSDWTQAEALWKHVLFNGLGLRRAQNESPVLLTLFPGLSRETYEHTCQIFFERLNVAGFSILERPTAQLYAANALAGVAVDIGRSHTDITPFYDGLPINNARITIPLGTEMCARYLVPLLGGNTSVAQALDGLGIQGPARQAALEELAAHAWRSGLVRAPGAVDQPAPEDEGVTDIAAVVVAGKERAVIESGMKKKATAKQTKEEQARAREIEALDLVTTRFRGVELTLGRERHRFCEPLFDAGLLVAMGEREAVVDKGMLMTIPQAVVHAVRECEVDQRRDIYSGLLVTGDIASHVKGLGTTLTARLAPYMLSNQENAQMNDVQPVQARTVRVPDYFAEFRDRGDGLAAFLGASIVAKITFHDGKNFVNKSEYSEKGPKAVLEYSPSLL
ncbi:unnamed protein product [Peniophora sp. CBMAI 1063]|nr:unnamed protein product [Peniophora sp. CBMAI 1063]